MPEAQTCDLNRAPVITGKIAQWACAPKGTPAHVSDQHFMRAGFKKNLNYFGRSPDIAGKGIKSMWDGFYQACVMPF